MIYSSLPFILYGNHIHIIWKTTSETNEKIENIGVSYATSSFYIAGNTPFFKRNLMQQIYCHFKKTVRQWVRKLLETVTARYLVNIRKVS